MNFFLKRLLFFSIAVSLPLFLFCVKTSYAQEVSCQDSDLGRSYYSKGEIKTGGNLVWQDVCHNSTQVQEGYCDPASADGYKTIVFSCPNGCQDGACQPFINIWFPAADKTLEEGDTLDIRWGYEGLRGDDEVQVFVVRSDGLQGEIAKVPISSSSYLWKVETDLSDWHYPSSMKEKNPLPIVFDEDNNLSFEYKILIIATKGKIGVSSSGVLNVIKRPGFDLVLGEKLSTEDPAGFKLEVCNNGNKNLDEPNKVIKGEITAILSSNSAGGNPAVSKMFSLLDAKIEQGKCQETSVVPYYDLVMDKKEKYEIKVALDPDNEIKELIEGDAKTLHIIPQPGIKVVSPGEKERWGIGSRRRISLQVSGPEMWTKIEIKAVDKLSEKEYLIDAVHVSPPELDYWWTIPKDLPAGEQYTIKISSQDPDFKEAKSSTFAIIEPMFSCSDSDNGSGYYQKGRAEGIFFAMKEAAEARSADDFCLDENTLVEYFCKDDYTSSERFECPFGCGNGACWKSAEEKMNEPAPTLTPVPTPTPAPTPNPTPTPVPTLAKLHMAKNNIKASPLPKKIVIQPTPVLLRREAPAIDNFRSQMSSISSSLSKVFEFIKEISGD